MDYEEQLKKFKDRFNELSRMHNKWEVFYDFVKMSAISLNNSLYKNNELEDDYLSTIRKYNKKEQKMFCELFGQLVLTYNSATPLTDILGEFYEKEKLSSKDFGQFFTPSHISDFMAKLMVGDANKLKEDLKTKEFISLNEPCSGGGGMILSFAKALKDIDINYQQKLLVVSCDIDNFCTFITYIQLCLYGIPAIVKCGNTLTNKMRFELKTFSFYVQYSKFRKFFLMQKNKKNQNNIIINSEEKSKKNLKLNEVTVNGNCQISLW